MENLPTYIGLVFGLTTGLTVWLFYKATNQSRFPLSLVLIWLLVQSLIAWSGFYTVTDTMPPRFLGLVLPPLLLIISLFFKASGKRFLDKLNPAYLTLLHVVRVPVELVLFWLFLHQVVPEVMTFEGRNLDIISGLTAPVVFYYGYIRKRLSKGVLLAWNLACLVLLFNIVITAILSAPVPFQMLAFEQPNIAVFHFPFVWLPGCIVPLVLFSHLAAIRHLLVSSALNTKKTGKGAASAAAAAAAAKPLEGHFH